MYGFRKPFSAATFHEQSEYLGIGFKSLIVASQLLGYTLSKFIGIKVVSEAGRTGRAWMILGLIGAAHFSLLLFALTPAPYNAFFLFLNGLPLGIVYGLVLSFLEGRKVSEALIAGLCCSFIFASGFTKTVGRTLLKNDVSDFWMPFLSGCVFILPLILGVWLLSHISPPCESEAEDRTVRKQMDARGRFVFFRKYWQGISILAVLFVVLTVYRSWRDDFSVELFQEMGYGAEPETFSYSEMIVAIVTTVIAGLTFLIPSHRLAFLSSLFLSGAGMAAVMGCVLARQAGWMDPFVFMVLGGIAIYVPYVLFHTTLLERMIAVFKEPATVGFLMYIVDSAGYLVYLLLLLVNTIPSSEGGSLLKSFVGEGGFLPILDGVALTSCLLGAPLTVYASWYFSAKTRNSQQGLVVDTNPVSATP